MTAERGRYEGRYKWFVFWGKKNGVRVVKYLKCTEVVVEKMLQLEHSVID